jgi:hypothetical protein
VIQYVHVCSWVILTKDSATLLQLGVSRMDTMKIRGLIGEIVGVRSVPIKFEAEGKKRSLEIPSAIDLTIEGITGGDQKSESVITNPPMSVTPGFPMMVGKSVKYTYNDHGMKWDNSGKNGFYSKFAYTA